MVIQRADKASRPEYLTVYDGTAKSDFVSIFKIIAKAETSGKR